MRRLNARVSALGTPQFVKILDGTEEPETTNWRTEYGGSRDEATGKVELPTPAFTPCPFENCPDCERERDE
ncbi:hypothetical protein [Streptomyces sp. 4F14]|uniref:hypothetical protein n=1 Tax=Streptomyces sp. 4F14 TaxID=3394380 RepID=UPI003A86C8C3